MEVKDDFKFLSFRTVLRFELERVKSENQRHKTFFVFILNKKLLSFHFIAEGGVNRDPLIAAFFHPCLQRVYSMAILTSTLSHDDVPKIKTTCFFSTVPA